MKNFVRALVLALVATGAIASIHSNSAVAQANLAPRASALPIPTCPPDDPSGCGMCRLNGNCAK
jgi:hypothetical protein